MTAQTKTVLKGYFNTGDIPTETNFADLIDTIGYATLTVAANDASDASKGRADYLCDGTADDVQINAAIAALPATGGRIVLTEGQFNLAATINDNSLNNVTIEGQGWGTLLYLSDSANCNMFTLSSVSGWAFRGFKINGNYSNQNQAGLKGTFYCTTVTDSLFEHLEIVNSVYAGVRLDTGCAYNTVRACRISAPYNDAVYITSTAHHNLVDGCYLAASVNDEQVQLSYGAYYNTISNCTIVQGGTTCGGIYVTGGGSNSPGNKVIGCTVIGDNAGRAGYGLSVSDANSDDVIFASNHVYGWATGISVSGGRTSIIGNVIYDCEFGIELNSGISQVTGNLVYGCQYEGLGIQSNYCTILGNCALNNDQANINRYGFRVYGNGSNNVLVGNVATDDQGVKTQSGGISEGVGSDSNIIANNNVSGNDTGKISLSGGAQTLVQGNIGYLTENCGTGDAVADGGTINHGLALTPTLVLATGSVANEFVSVTAIAATTFTVAIKKHDGSAGTAQTIYWRAYGSQEEPSPSLSPSSSTSPSVSPSVSPSTG